MKISGTECAKIWLTELQDVRERGRLRKFPQPRLLLGMSHPNPASKIWTEAILRHCETLDIDARINDWTNETKEFIRRDLKYLSYNSYYDGILLLTPFHETPEDIDYFRSQIVPDQDVGGIRPTILEELADSESRFLIPCVPKGIFYLLAHNLYSVRRMDCLIISRSIGIGLPLAQMLTARDATVTIAHMGTTNLKDKLSRADFVFTATGKPCLFDAHDLKERAVVIDIGYGRKRGLGKNPDKWTGDFNSEIIFSEDKDYDYTPVPGGVGPMTTMALMANVIQAWWYHNTGRILDQTYGSPWKTVTTDFFGNVWRGIFNGFQNR